MDSKYYDVEDLSELSESTHKFKYRILHIHIQGLLSSLDNLKLLLERLTQNKVTIDVILICEIFLHGSNTDSNYENICKISGYDFIFKNRQKKTKGGIALYMSNNIQYIRRDDLSIFHEGEYESLFVEIKDAQKNVIIGEIYRVPGTHEQQSLERYEESISLILAEGNKNTILATDQNFNFLNINEHKHTSDLLELYLSNGLIPTITRPTRITHTSQTLIDIHLHK